MKSIVLAVSIVSLTTVLAGCGSGGGGSSPEGGVGITPTPVPATGQTTSQVNYDDGWYKDIHPMSFTDNGDGTIKDNVTGLLWQQIATDTVSWYQASGAYHLTYNNSGINYCANLGSGWRLPTRFELMTIADYGKPSPAINALLTASASLYWTSTSDDASNAWYVSFLNGSSSSWAKASLYSVRCVKGQEFKPGGALSDHGNGTVTDQATNLMWEKCSRGQNNDTTCSTNGAETPSTDWAAAIAYCEGLERGGFTDWRLPNIKELSSVADLAVSNPAINAAFPSTYALGYWSSSTYSADSLKAWTTNFFAGSVNSDYKAASKYVRCVRGQ